MGVNTTINDCLCLSLTRCKELGYFAPNATAEGVITWSWNGRKYAAVRFMTDTVNHRCGIAYKTNDGEEIQQFIQLRWRPSNLSKPDNLNTDKGGYYYFVCPSTGRACRKLYLINGRFVSRFAFRHIYEQQKKSRNQRESPLMETLAVWDELERLQQQKYRRYTYKGKPTPFARKVERLARKADKMRTQTDRYLERHT